ncbi:MAG: GNAT family N-acetyltransferase [Sandarakinorhabdus sp.]|nr:GNAT family N-acetyltransferase [Sandarakinorhabdus sp.]
MFATRRLTLDDAAAADLHRRAGALIPGYDTSLHTPAEFIALYRDEVLPGGPVWGIFDGARLCGHVALLPGWIDHVYVEPALHGQGVGSSLVLLAQDQPSELRLYTFQSNMRAQALYDRHGFIVEERTDGARNAEKVPDMTYHWRRD